jgi:para-nitrobenzyl esterase
VPLLAGWNRDEGNSEGMTAEKWKAFADENSRSARKSSSSSTPATPMSRRRARRPTSTATRSSRSEPGSGSRRIARLAIRRSTVITLNWPAPPSKFEVGGLAFHSDDIEYVFGTLDTRPGAVWKPEDRKLSDQMMDYWTNFARTGDPNGRGCR